MEFFGALKMKEMYSLLLQTTLLISSTSDDSHGITHGAIEKVGASQ